LTLEICFLGTGAPWPDPLRGSSAILVDIGSARILLDCGRACVQQMARLHIEPASIAGLNLVALRKAAPITGLRSARHQGHVGCIV
jgi:ribonuclease BN (tRNA processing enzyme)